MTRQWEEIMGQYVNGLCFSKEQGLYTRLISDGEQADDIIYRPHGFKGFVSDTINIPEEKLSIRIESNFGFGSWAYLYAIIERDGHRLLDFDLSKMYIHNKCSIATFDVPLYNWNALFNKIITAYKDSISDSYKTSSIEYVDEISAILDKDEIYIKPKYEDTKLVKWHGDKEIMIFASSKIKGLLSGVELAHVSDAFLLKHIYSLCVKYIEKLRPFTMDLSDSALSHLSETLLLVHQFMHDTKADAEYIKLLIGKKE